MLTAVGCGATPSGIVSILGLLAFPQSRSWSFLHPTPFSCVEELSSMHAILNQYFIDRCSMLNFSLSLKYLPVRSTIYSRPARDVFNTKPICTKYSQYHDVELHVFGPIGLHTDFPLLFCPVHLSLVLPPTCQGPRTENSCCLRILVRAKMAWWSLPICHGRGT